MDVPSSPESEEFLEHQEDDQSITEPENEVVYVDDEGNQVEPEEGTVYIDEYGNMIVGKQEISDQEEAEPESNDQGEEEQEEEEEEVEEAEEEKDDSAEESEEVQEVAEEDHAASEQPEVNEENAEADENPHHPEEAEEQQPESDEGEEEEAEEVELEEEEEGEEELLLDEDQPMTITEEELRAILEANASKRLELRKLSQEHMRYWKEEQKMLEDMRTAEERDYYESFRRDQLDKTARYFELTKPRNVEPVQKKDSIFNVPPMLDRMETQRIENQRLIQKRKVWHQGLRKSVQEIKRFSKTVSDRNEPDLNESLKNVKLHDEFSSTTLPISPSKSSPKSSKQYSNIQSPTKNFIENFTEKSRDGISPRIETEEKRAQHLNQMIVFSSPKSSHSGKQHSLTKMWNETVKNKPPVHLRSTKSIPSINATSSAPSSAPVSREVSPKKSTPKSKRPNISPMKARMLELVGMVNSPSGPYAPTPPNSTRRFVQSMSADSTSNAVDDVQLAQQLQDIREATSVSLQAVEATPTTTVSEPVEQESVGVTAEEPEEKPQQLQETSQEPQENGNSSEEATLPETSQEFREENTPVSETKAESNESPKSIEDNLTAKLHRMVEMRRKMQQKQ